MMEEQDYLDLLKTATNPKHRKFIRKCYKLGYEVFAYEGRFMHKGFGIEVMRILDTAAKIGMTGLRYDNLATHFVVYI